MFIIQLLIVLALIYAGSRYGSVAIGAFSGIGLAILVFGFGMAPGTPPTDVIYIIIAAVTCASIMSAAGGMDYLIQFAERLIRRHPQHITILAPLCTFTLTVLVGTGHVVYTLMPIIADVALKKGVRPERPCAVASIASQVGITSSPIAAAVVAFSTISAANGFPVTIPQIMMVTLPAGFCGVLLAALCSTRRGKDLDKDEEFQKRLADPEMRAYMYGDVNSTLGQQISRKAKLSVWILLAAIACIVLLACFHYSHIKMNLAIQIVMLSASGLMIFLCDVKPNQVAGNAVFRNGMVAVIAIFGVAWMADTFFGAYIEDMKNSFGALMAAKPWLISILFFLTSVLLNSQGAVVVAMLPLAYSFGIPGYVLLGVLPSVYGYFFIPNYPSDLATVNFDKSGTTRIGKYLFNHSFMMPGLVSVISSSAIGLAISALLFA